MKNYFERESSDNFFEEKVDNSSKKVAKKKYGRNFR